MCLWQIWLIIGIAFFTIDLFATTMFLVNIAFAFWLMAICSYLGLNIYIQTIVFIVSSILLLVFLRPVLIGIFKPKEYDEFTSKYINQQAKVIVKITSTGGRISIYGEEWDAKTEDGSVVEQDEFVKIIKRDNMSMIVEKL